MEIDVSKKQICINKLACEKKEIVFIEEDMIIPDSKPDILNSIDLNGNVCIYKKEIMDGRIKIDGCINTYIMYLPDSKDDKLRGLNASIEFSQSISIPECKEGMLAETKVEIKDLECKVLNGRKINVRAGLEIRVKLFSNEDIEITTDINNIEDVQTLYDTLWMDSFIGNGSQKVYVKDTLKVDEEDDIAEILKVEVSLEDSDIKISYNKILSKCEAKVKIMYLTEDNRIKTINGRIPAVGFIDMPNISEEHICKTDNEIKNILIRPNSSEEHSIYVEIEIETNCIAFEKREIELIQDLYSPSQNLGFSQKKINTTLNRISNNKMFNISSTTNIPDLVDGKLIDVEINTSIIKEEKTKEKLIYEGEMNVNYIFLNSNGNVNSKIQKIPFKIDDENILQDDNVSVDTRIKELNKNIDVQSNGDIGFTVDMEAISEFSKNTIINIIDNIEIKENVENSNDYNSLVIYIVQEGDTLWKIAKKFRSTVEDIASVNEIEIQRQIQVGQKIYIPKFKYVNRKGKVDAVSA